MFCIIEYTDYRKEQQIKVHGYSNKKEEAIEFARDEINKIIIKDGGYFTENYEENKYINLVNNKICEFRIFDIDELPDNEVIDYMTKAISNNQNIEEFIFSCISENAPFPTIYESIKHKKIIDCNTKEVRTILNYLALKYHPLDFGPDRFFTHSVVIAVIELGKI